MDDLINRQAAIDAIEKLILPQTKGETAAEKINRVAWRCAINCAEEMIGHLPSAERRGRWIPITERLPEDEGQYLVCCNSKYPIEVGRFYINAEGDRWFCCDWNNTEDIVAWMPLHEPYKGGVERMSELDKLEKYLKEHGYEYTREDFDGSPSYDRKNQIIVYKNGERTWDAVCQPGSYGYEEGLLEIYGDIVWHDIDGDCVRGWLTEDDVISRIERGAEGARE